MIIGNYKKNVSIHDDAIDDQNKISVSMTITSKFENELRKKNVCDTTFLHFPSFLFSVVDQCGFWTIEISR